MPTPGSFAAIILAAGSSSRMGAGRHKLLLPLGNRPVLAHVIAATLASQARPIVIVLGHQAEQVRTQIADLYCLPCCDQHRKSALSSGNEHIVTGRASSTYTKWEHTTGQYSIPLTVLLFCLEINR